MAGTSVVQRQGNELAPCRPVPAAVCSGVLRSRGTIQVNCTPTGVPGCCRSVTTLTPESLPPGVCLCMRKGGEGHPFVTLSQADLLWVAFSTSVTAGDALSCYSSWNQEQVSVSFR